MNYDRWDAVGTRDCMMRSAGQASQESALINGIKLEYLCCNKHPGIIFVLMHGAD